MTASSLDNEASSSEEISIFDRHHIRYYLLTLFSFAGIVLLYQLFSGGLFAPPSGPGGFGPPGEINQIPQNLWNLIWPLWGVPAPPTLSGLAVILFSAAIVATMLYHFKEAHLRSVSFVGLAVLGIALSVMTNFAHGYEIGIWQPTGGNTELLVDALQITNPVSFISNYSTLQPSLSVHAQTQPPGAVLTIYLLNLLLNNAGLVSIAICVLSYISSTFFMHGIYKRLFDDESSRYAIFLFVVLPAIQVYYLANIYAIVCALFLGFLYFYFHENRGAGIIGSGITLILGTFISFLFAFAILFMVLFELLRARSVSKNERSSLLSSILSGFKMPVFLIGLVGLFYASLQMIFGFSYIDAFLYASSLENPNGFMLLATPGVYFVTRVQNILDIVFFFGPVLTVLGIQGVHHLRNEKEQDEQSRRVYLIVVAALLALALMFLAGAPKKGETARICMFILPVLLMPVISYLESIESQWRQRAMLVGLVFAQALLMQALFVFVW